MSAEKTAAAVVQMPGTDEARVAATGVLLQRPRYTCPPDCHTVYGLRRGRVLSAPLASYRLPAACRGDTLVFPGREDRDGVEFLPRLAALADRIAPWVKVDVVPTVASARPEGDDFGTSSGRWHVGDRTYVGCGGLACDRQGLVLLQLAGPDFMLATLLHELLHMIWRNHLSEAARQAITDAVAAGPEWPGGYYGQPEEQACRLFESWAFAQLAGMPGYTFDDAEINAHRVFRDILDGSLADHLIATGLVQAPDYVKAAQGLLPPPPAPPTVAGRVRAAAFDWARERLRRRAA